jgi:hypothetical protein
MRVCVCLCLCVCLLLQYLLQSCSRGVEGKVEDMCYDCIIAVVCLLLQYLLQSCSCVCVGKGGGHVLRETTSRGLCGPITRARVCVFYYCRT